MLKSITLENFKSFRAATLPLGQLTLLVGTNASGKSNLRDAFRLLHGVGRGYSLSEIIGEKWGEGGELQWKGIRGGVNEIAFGKGKRFTVSARFTPPPIGPGSLGREAASRYPRIRKLCPEVAELEEHVRRAAKASPGR